MLDLADLERGARVLEGIATELRDADRRLERGLAGTQWVSSAASRFAGEADELGRRLRRCADECDQAADALRDHAAAVARREAALGEAAEAMMAAAHGAARQGVAAVQSAMAGAERAFFEAARAAREALEDAGGAISDGVKGGVRALGKLL